MDASADAPRRSFAFGLERAGFIGLAWPRLTVVLVILVSVLAGVGPHAPQGRRFAVRAVPHRHRGVPPLRGDRPPLSVQRVRRAGGGRGQGPPEEGRSSRPSAAPSSTCSSPTASTASSRCCRRAASRTPPAMRRRSCPTSCPTGRPTTPSSPRSRPTRSSPASSCPTTASWRWPCWRSTGPRCRSRAPSRSSAASTRR